MSRKTFALWLVLFTLVAATLHADISTITPDSAPCVDSGHAIPAP